MDTPTYRHNIRFRGSTHPKGKYQLQICERSENGQLIYRAQWDFHTLKALLCFLKKYFPYSQSLTPIANQPSTHFDSVLSASGIWDTEPTTAVLAGV